MFEEKGEPKRIRTEVPLLTSLTPYRWAKLARRGSDLTSCLWVTCVLKPGICHLVCIVQELCDSRGGRPGLFVLTSLLVSVDVKLY